LCAGDTRGFSDETSYPPLMFVPSTVVALMAIKGALTDPHNVLENWDSSSVDPCSWRMITCSSDGSVSAL